MTESAVNSESDLLSCLNSNFLHIRFIFVVYFQGGYQQCPEKWKKGYVIILLFMNLKIVKRIIVYYVFLERRRKHGLGKTISEEKLMDLLFYSVALQSKGGKNNFV